MSKEFIDFFEGDGACQVLISNLDAFQSNQRNAQALWVLQVTNRNYLCVINSLRWDVALGQFAAFGAELSPLASGGRSKLVWVSDRGCLTRESLEDRISYFDDIGVDRRWWYFEYAANREATVRRLITGEQIHSPITEFDYRKARSEPIVRTYSS
jgi:hypothetical protein